MSTTINVPVINNSKNPLPKYETTEAAGMDLRASLTNLSSKFLFNAYIESGKVIIEPRGRALIPTDLHMSIPEGYELQIRPRSGLALKYGITELNTPGTIDADYTGNIGIIIINHGEKPFMVENGDRIAQGVFAKIVNAEFQSVNSLEKTERGDGGFGHTNVK